MNTMIDYKTEKRGWVLLEGATGQFFLDHNLVTGLFRTSSEVGDAMLFRTKSAALKAAKEVLPDGAWYAVPVKLTNFIEATKAVRAKGG